MHTGHVNVIPLSHTYVQFLPGPCAQWHTVH